MRKSKNITSYAQSDVSKLIAEGRKKSDQQKIRRMSKKQQAAARASDEDAALTPSPETWDDLIVEIVPPKEPLYMRLDADVLRWFKSQGRGYQSQINAVLRSYMMAKQNRHHPLP